MKEVWKTILMDAPKDIRPGSFIIVYITTDGTMVGHGIGVLTIEQSNELKKYYKDNYKAPYKETEGFYPNIDEAK
jgi:hypothetical protein